MDVIPVVDLMGGTVVRAIAGQRERYQPLTSPLCSSSRPVDVVRRLCELYPFWTLYVADLDAIQKRGAQGAAIASIRAAFPDLELWVDGGLADIEACRQWLAKGLGALVLGSESQTGLETLRAVGSEAPERVVLSLDFDADGFRGPPALLETPELWPPRVIVMTLARIGGAKGPDVERLGAVLGKAGSRRIYAAGGIRGRADLERLTRLGASGALVASSLHDGRLGREDIEQVTGR